MSAVHNTLPAPPVARKAPVETRMHGYALQDDYSWLQQKEEAEVLEYLAAENTYTDAVMAPTE